MAGPNTYFNMKVCIEDLKPYLGFFGRCVGHSGILVGVVIAILDVADTVPLHRQPFHRGIYVCCFP